MARGKGNKTGADDSFKSLLARLDDNSGERLRAAAPEGVVKASRQRQEQASRPMPATPSPDSPQSLSHALPPHPMPRPLQPLRPHPADPRGNPAIVWASIGVGLTSLSALGVLGWMWISHQQNSARTVENSMEARPSKTVRPATADAEPARALPPTGTRRGQAPPPIQMDTLLAAASPSLAPPPASPTAPPTEGVVRNFAQAPADEPPVRLVPHDTRTPLPASEVEAEPAAPVQLPSRRTFEATAPSPPVQPAPPEPTVNPPDPKLLVAPTLRARAGDATPYAAKIDAAGHPMEGLRVVITGVPAGATLSAGSIAGQGTWHVPANAIERLHLRLPTQVGDSFPLTLELQDGDGRILARETTLVVVLPAPSAAPPAPPAFPPVAVVPPPAAPPAPPPPASAPPASAPPASAPPASAPPASAPPASAPMAAPPVASTPAAAPPAAATIPRLSMDEDTAMIERGRLLARTGDIAAARLLFERAADAGSGRAALLLGETYDPDVLANMGVLGPRGDIARARRWYARAQELGLPQAGERLKALAGR